MSKRHDYRSRRRTDTPVTSDLIVFTIHEVTIDLRTIVRLCLFAKVPVFFLGLSAVGSVSCRATRVITDCRDSSVADRDSSVGRDRLTVGWLNGFFIHHIHRGMRGGVPADCRDSSLVADCRDSSVADRDSSVGRNQ